MSTLILLIFFSLPYPIYRIVQFRKFVFDPLESKKLNNTKHYNILILGAGKNNDKLLTENLRLNQEVISRLVEGVKWCNRLPRFTLICSGPLIEGDKSQALLLKETAIELGVYYKFIEMIELGQNTKTEAEQYVKHYGINTPLILCTSALHMRRAKEWFAYNGVKNIFPAPSSFLCPHQPISWKLFLPAWSSFFNWQNYFKEVLGERLVPRTI